eukprot:TRINITY_DN28643_c0_g1_i1.p1 TRINITY_DN28643_c0_g1~~TRINITY_DN28643_c0_g1_i1.p1  ORF type:complete len:476 (+),score=98.59 TRINITY_DN28643_c0_g1_i1:35-1429(+)
MPRSTSRGSIKPGTLDGLLTRRPSQRIGDGAHFIDNMINGGERLAARSGSFQSGGSGSRRSDSSSAMPMGDGTELVKAGSTAMLCQEITRMQEQYDVLEAQLRDTLTRYDQLLDNKLNEFDVRGGIEKVSQKLVKANDELTILKTDNEDLRLQLRAAQRQSDRFEERSNEFSKKYQFTTQEMSASEKANQMIITHLKDEIKMLTSRVDEYHLKMAQVPTVVPKVLVSTEVQTCDILIKDDSTSLLSEQEKTQSGDVFTAPELAALLEAVRGDLDGQLLSLREGLISHHLQGQLTLKQDTERRLSELTSGVESQLEYLHKAAALQEEYATTAGSVADLEREIKKLSDVKSQREQQLHNLQIENDLITNKISKYEPQRSNSLPRRGMSIQSHGGTVTPAGVVEPSVAPTNMSTSSPWTFTRLQGEMSNLLHSLRANSEDRPHAGIPPPGVPPAGIPQRCTPGSVFV